MEMEQGNTVVLVADDEPIIQNMMVRFLNRKGYTPVVASDGIEALGKARAELPQLILLDVKMPEMDGLHVCRELRDDPSTSLIPILFISAKGEMEDKVSGFGAGADDYLLKPFDFPELEARMSALLKRNQKMISVNPLTHLPGAFSIQEEIEKRIHDGQTFGAAYIDIDNFKAYNDVYGYSQGDQVILWASKVIRNAAFNVAKGGSPGAFIGHIGGDDFMLIAEGDKIQQLSEAVAEEFDRGRKQWYLGRHSIQECIFTRDRMGNTHRFPLMTLSIAVSTNEKRVITHYAEVSQITSELKHYAKSRADKTKSFVVKDRRTY